MNKQIPLGHALESEEGYDQQNTLLRESDLELVRKEWDRRLKMQKWVPYYIIVLVTLWLVFMGVLVVSNGLEWLDYHPSVLVALISSATVSIVGLLMKVVSYTLPSIG